MWEDDAAVFGYVEDGAGGVGVMSKEVLMGVLRGNGAWVIDSGITARGWTGFSEAKERDRIHAKCRGSARFGVAFYTFLLGYEGRYGVFSKTRRPISTMSNVAGNSKL